MPSMHRRALGGIWAMLSTARHSHSPPWVAARPQNVPQGGARGTPLHRGVRVGVPLACLEAQAAALAPTAACGEAGDWGGGQGGIFCPWPQCHARDRAASAGRWGQRGLGEGQWDTRGCGGGCWLLGCCRFWGQDLLLAARIGIPSPRLGCPHEVSEGTGRWAAQSQLAPTGARTLPAGHPACFASPAVPQQPGAARTPEIPAHWEPRPGLRMWGRSMGCPEHPSMWPCAPCWVVTGHSMHRPRVFYPWEQG